MANGEPAAPDAGEAPAEGEAKKENDLVILLVPSVTLDTKVEKEGQTPRIMEPARDGAGTLLIQKYEKLTKPFWKKYRNRNDCPPVHFICEIPLAIIENINSTFLLPEDLQFLGACFAQNGSLQAADQFFNEAMRTGEIDAFINAGVFRYRLGERGVIDNFSLAKRHLTKAIGLLHINTRLTSDEKLQRRKMCMETIDEIDYRFAPFLEKIIKFIVRILTFRFEANVHYVGAAAPLLPVVHKLQELTDSVLKFELGQKVQAIRKFLVDLQTHLPSDQPGLEEQIQDILKKCDTIQAQDALDGVVGKISDFYTENQAVLERYLEEVKAEAEVTPKGPANVEEVCYQLASFDEVRKLSERHKLLGVADLVSMARASRITNDVIAYLALEKMDEFEVMEQLHKNPAVPDALKKFIRDRHSFLQAPTGDNT